MAKSFDENTCIEFRMVLAYLKERWSCSDEQLGEKIGCSAKTVSSMRNNPLGVSSGYTERVRRYARLESKKEASEEAEEIRRLL